MIRTPEELVEELHALAVRKNWSMSDLARELGVERQRVAGWFTDRRSPRTDYALRIAALLAREKRRARRARKPNPVTPEPVAYENDR